MAVAYFQVGGEVKSYRAPEGRELDIIWLMALIATTASEAPKTLLGIGVDWD